MPKPKARANGEGSVFERKDKGVWIAQVRGRDAAGKVVYRTKTASSQKEALKKLRELQNDIQTLGHLSRAKKGTVRAFLEKWYKGNDDHAGHKNTIRVTTQHSYENTLNKHIYPSELGLANKQIDSLSITDIRAFYKKLADTNRGARTRQLVHQILSAAFRQGLIDGTLTRNPLASLSKREKPKYDAGIPRIYNTSQQATFLQASKDDFYHAAFMLALDFGGREGEILGLSLADVNLRDRKVTIRRQLFEVGKTVDFGPPKSDYGLRTVDISEATANAIKDHKKRLLSKGFDNPDNLLFPDEETGGRMRKFKLLDRMDKIIEKAGLEKVTFHGLRHSAATRMIEQGVPLQVVRHRLGHHNISITLQIYAHVSDAAGKSAADKFDEALAKAE
jgi:integrase